MTQLLHYILLYGVWLIFINVLLEQLGAPVPAVPALIVAGALSRDGKMSSTNILLAAIAAALIADYAWFLLGRRYGYRILRALCRASLSPDACVRDTEARFERWGLKSLLIAKFIPGFSTVAPPLAGASGRGTLAFVIYDGIGALIWSGAAVATGRAFHREIDRLLAALENLGGWAFVVIGCLLAVMIAVKWAQRIDLLNQLRLARIERRKLKEMVDRGDVITGKESGWLFFHRELSSAESQLVSIAAAMIAAVVATLSIKMWTSVWGFIFVTAIATLPIVVLRLHKARTLTAIAIFGLPIVCASFDDVRFLLLGFILLLTAVALRWVGQRRALRRAALLATIRDAAWRVTGLMAVAIASIAAADRVERAVFEASFNTPLEGLALSGGILVGALLFLALGTAVWSLPRFAAKRMRGGLSLPSASAEALWFGTLVSALAIGFDLRAIAATGAFSEALGRGSWIAVASAFAFAATRLASPALIRPDVQPLWIVVLGERVSPWVLRYVANLAARWENGPVTIVGAPEVAPRMRGAHLRLAQSRGEVHALFPQRPIHLADWLDTLPPRDRWETLPVRELYCDDSLWSDLFETQLETTAEVVVVVEKEVESARDPLPMLPIGRTELHVPTSHSLVITSRLDERDTRTTSLNAWISATALVREKTGGVRFALVAHTNRDKDFANRLVKALRGSTDGRGRTVRARGVVLGGAVNWLVLQVRRANIMYWTLGIGMQRMRRLSGGVSHGRWFEGLAGFVVTLLSFGIDAEYDLLLIEREDILDDEDVWNVVERKAIEAANRVISVTDDAVTESKGADSAFSGVIRYPFAVDIQTQIEDITRRYLTLDFEPMAPRPQSTAQVPPVEKRRPQVYLAFPREYADIARSLQRRLQETGDFLTAETIGPGENLLNDLEHRIKTSDAVIAIYGPDTAGSPWVIDELKLAASVGIPILLLLVRSGLLPPLLEGIAPLNLDANGNLRDLTEESEDGTEPGLDLAVEKINRALARLATDRPATIRT